MPVCPESSPNGFSPNYMASTEDSQEEPPKSRSPRPDLSLITTTCDRAELIERLKRGESPTWVPNRKLDACHPRNGSCDPPRAASPRPISPPALPLTTTTTTTTDETAEEQRLQHGLNIQRPRSALHSGDFTQHAAREETVVVGGKTEETNKWFFATSPPRDFTLSSNFVYKPPTSPLVQSESNEDDDSINSMDLDPSTPTRTPRRQTMHSPYNSTPVTAQRIIPSVRREGTFPYQAHQPRKSLTSVPLMGTSPGSLSSSSPLQQTSMVGSYEESILRGRMSTTPSKPLDFLAQIGVLGLGANCKSSLRCPAHVTLPFPAVFYSYASTPVGRSSSDDGPSPYVGQVDLENGLPNPEEASRTRRRLSKPARGRREPSSTMDDLVVANEKLPLPPDARDIAKQRRRTTGSGPKAPPGGSYRIPEKGQIQIIIKNQNKTAVKLFLVPYDLAGMEPGTKTFIRQRSYSGGSGDEDGEAAPERPVLRYLVHLHICCPARGRFYLYKSIRVVFANRVPDGKEKLRNEVTLPEPKFTPYKPIRVMTMHSAMSSAASSLAADKAFRRRSSGFSFGGALQMGEHSMMMPQPDFSGFSLRARASSMQDRGAVGLERSPLTVMESPTSDPASFVPMNFAKGGYGHGHGGGSRSMMTDGESLLSQRLRSLGMGIGGQMLDKRQEDRGTD